MLRLEQLRTYDRREVRVSVARVCHMRVVAEPVVAKSSCDVEWKAIHAQIGSTIHTIPLSKLCQCEADWVHQLRVVFVNLLVQGPGWTLQDGP